MGVYGDSIQGQHLLVRQYSIYLNGRAALENEDTSGLTGILPGLLRPGPVLKAKCEHSRMTAGWFDTSEVANNFSPIVIEMDISFQGKDVVVRSVDSPEVETWMDFNNHSLKPVLAASVQHAITKANLALIAELKKGAHPAG